MSEARGGKDKLHFISTDAIVKLDNWMSCREVSVVLSLCLLIA